VLVLCWANWLQAESFPCRRLLAWRNYCSWNWWVKNNSEDKTLISTFIICLAPWAGKMNRISRCDWLPERARWSYLARSGCELCPARKIYPRRNGWFPRIFFLSFFPEKSFPRQLKISCGLCIDGVKKRRKLNASTRKKTKMLTSFMNLFCNKNRQTQNYKHKVT